MCDVVVVVHVDLHGYDDVYKEWGLRKKCVLKRSLKCVKEEVLVDYCIWSFHEVGLVMWSDIVIQEGRYQCVFLYCMLCMNM